MRDKKEKKKRKFKEEPGAKITEESTGETSADSFEEDGEPEEKNWWKRRRKKKFRQEQLIRIAELEEMMSKYGDEVDPESIVSMYLPHRKAKKNRCGTAATGQVNLALLGMLLLVVVLFIAAFMQEKMGNFTINLDRLELYRKGISIADNGDFDGATARLTATTVADATNISIEDLPADLDDVEGAHNGKNYMAYTYYVRNAGKEDLGYIARITLDSCAKERKMPSALRYGETENGLSMPNRLPMAARKQAVPVLNQRIQSVSYEEKDFLVGNVDKYTIVIWMEGDDSECVDSIIGGSVQFSMRIDADYDDDTSLLSKFYADIKDTLTATNRSMPR